MYLLETCAPTHPRLHANQGKAESRREEEFHRDIEKQMALFEDGSKEPIIDFQRIRSPAMEAGARTPKPRFNAPMEKRGVSLEQTLLWRQEQLTQKTLEAQFGLSEGQYQSAAGSRAQSERSHDAEIDFE